MVQKFKENPDKFLATIQVGITLAGTLVSALVGAYAISIFMSFDDLQCLFLKQ